MRDVARVYRPDLKACSESSSPVENLLFLRGPAWATVIHNEDSGGSEKEQMAENPNTVPQGRKLLPSSFYSDSQSTGRGSN